MGGFTIEPPSGASEFSVEPPEKSPVKTAGEAKDRFAEDLELTQKWAEGHPLLGPIARGVVSAGQNAATAIADAPGAVYHAFADPATPEETKRYGADQVTGAKRIGLGIGRVLGREQAENAIEDYTSGKVTLQAAKEVLPEAIGTGVGQVTGGAVYGKAGEIGTEGLSTVGKLRQKFGNAVPRQITGAEPALKEAVTKASEAHGEALKEHADTAANVEKRGELAKTVDVQSKELHGHLSKVEQSVAKEANAKFERVREKVGNPSAPAAELVDAVKNAETNILQGIPENIKEFRSILRHEELPEHIKGAAEAHGFELEGAEPLTWDKLQSLKSRLDARLRNARGMNGDLKRALFQTRDAVVGEMGKMAEANGARAEWTDARNFWRQYKEDFHEGTGPSGSASPIAQALSAEDPKNIRQPFLRTQTNIPQEAGGFENRATQILRKYPQHGGTEAAAHVEKLIGTHGELNDLPNRPKGFSPTAPEGPTVDAAKVTRDALAQRAKNWGAFNARDIGILASSVLAEPIMKLLGGNLGQGASSLLPVAAVAYEGGKYVASRALNSPKVIEWLSRTPPEEAAALSRIPGADKVKIVNMLTDQAVQSGRPVNLSPAAQQLLGPANVARIATAATAAIPKTPGEARARLRRTADDSGTVQ